MKTQEVLEINEFLRVFGCAVFCAQALESTLVTLFAASRLQLEGLNARDTLRELMDARYKQTLGKLINDACEKLKLPDQLCRDLRDALVERNWLIHHFYKEYAPVAVSSELRERMIPRLRDIWVKFENTSELIQQESMRRLQEAGLTEQEIKDGIEKATADYFTLNDIADGTA